MAYNSYNKNWENEVDGIVSKRDKLQDIKINQLKLEVHDTYKKDEKITTDFEPFSKEDVTNKDYLDEKLLKLNGHLSKLGNEYSEFKLQHNKQSVEDTFIQRAVKRTIPIINVKGLFDRYANADKVLEEFLFTKRRRGDISGQVNDVVQ